MVRIMAFLGALAGLAAIATQVVLLSVGNFGIELEESILMMVAQVGRWSQFAFILLMTVFLFLFALSKRPKAE